MKRNKPAVVDISDDESKSSVKKRVEPVSSHEIVELQQKLDKAEKDKQGAIRIAGEAQARVEFLENLLDKKRESQQDEGDGGDKKLVEELQKKIEELTKENEMARHKAIVAESEKMEIQKKNDELISKLAEYEGQQKKKEVIRNIEISAVHAQAVKKEEEIDVSIDGDDGFSMVPNITAPILAEPKEERKGTKDEEMVDDFVADKNSLNDHESNNGDDNESAVSMIPNFTRPSPKKPKEETNDVYESFPEDNQMSGLDFVDNEREIEDGRSLNETVTTGMDDGALEENNSLNELENDNNMGDFVDTFPDEIDSTLAENLLEGNEETLNEDDMSKVDDVAVAKKDTRNNQSLKVIEEGKEDQSSNQVMEKKRKSARRSTCLVQYKDSSDDSDDGEEEPNMKITRRESENKKKTKDENKKPSNNDVSDSRSDMQKQSSHANRSDNELKCPECEFRTGVVTTFLSHLRRKHSTTPFLSGLVLRCECGHESTSQQHSLQCSFSNTTIIRKKDGPIRRFEDAVAHQVKCVLCEAYPKSPQGYIQHLNNHHKDKSTLNANGIYLICSCGYEILSNNRYSMQHIKNCEETEFTIHKLKDKVHSTPQCVLCEAYPKTAIAYFIHLGRYHKEKSTLNANGIYLLCACGFEIRSEHSCRNHNKECDERQYTLHKENEEENNSE